MDKNTVNEAFSIGLERVKKRLPRFMEWLESNWESARPLEVRAAGKYDWLVDGDTPMVDDYTIEGGAIDDPRHTIWMVIGLGTGKALQKVLEKAGRHVARILLVEEDAAVWKCAMVNSQLRQIVASDERVFPVWDLAEMNVACTAALGNPIILGSTNRTLYIVHNGTAERTPDMPKAVLRAYSNFVQFRFSSLGNSAEDTLIGFSQIIRNYPNMARSYSLNDLKNRFAGYPAILVSAGPSLEKNVHLLKDVQDRCIIIAVDTVLRKLLPMGIKPHFVVSIERGRLVYDAHFTELPEGTEGVVPVISSVCLPEICGVWKGPLVMTFKTLPLDTWFAATTGLSIIPSGSSCAHMGLQLAYMLGCTKIALIGQDLAYSPEGKTHSDGTAWQGKKESIDSDNPNLMEVAGIFGGTVKTTRVWFFFKQVFETMIAERKDAVVYDATEGGVLIEGTRILPLHDFLMNEVEFLPPLDATPAACLETIPLARQEKKERLKEGLAEAADSLNMYITILDDLEQNIIRTFAPALSPRRRREHAFHVAATLDRLVSSSPIMTFILQGHLAIAAQKINDFKMLETSEELHSWRREMEELLATARTACLSARTMLTTLIRLIDEEPEHRMVFEELGCAEGLLSAEDSEKAWEIAEERGLKVFVFSLFSRFDFRKGFWSSKNTLALGRRALDLGFVERSRKLFSSLVQDKALARDPVFWNDYAVSYCLYEFGVDPSFDSARSAFFKAMKLDPKNEERSRNYLAMEHLLQRRADTLIKLVPERKKNAAAAMGLSWESVGKLEKAIEWYQYALDLAGADDLFRNTARQALERCHALVKKQDRISQVSPVHADK